MFLSTVLCVWTFSWQKSPKLPDGTCPKSLPLLASHASGPHRRLLVSVAKELDTTARREVSGDCNYNTIQDTVHVPGTVQSTLYELHHWIFTVPYAEAELVTLTPFYWEGKGHLEVLAWPRLLS